MWVIAQLEFELDCGLMICEGKPPPRSLGVLAVITPALPNSGYLAFLQARENLFGNEGDQEVRCAYDSADSK